MPPIRVCQKYYCQQTTLDDKQIIWEANSLPKSFAKKGEKKMLPIGDQRRSSLRVSDSEVRGHQQLVHQVSYYSLILRISKLRWSWSCVYSVFVFPLEPSIFLISAAPFKWASSSERTQPAVVRSSAHWEAQSHREPPSVNCCCCCSALGEQVDLYLYLYYLSAELFLIMGSQRNCFVIKARRKVLLWRERVPICICIHICIYIHIPIYKSPSETLSNIHWILGKRKFPKSPKKSNH